MKRARARLLAGAVGVLVAATSGLAQAQTSVHTDPAALAWLKRIYLATQKLSYTGTFIYQQGDEARASRIVHRVGNGTDIEKVEALDGAPRETLRTRDTVECYLPELHLVKIDRHGKRRGFPAMLPEQLGELPRHYVITLGGIDRIAGYECREIVLTPRDDFRYGYRLWADRKTGMLLKARTFDHAGRSIEQFAFAELHIGHVPRSAAQANRIPTGWRVEESSVAPVDIAAAGWSVRPELPGFHKIAEVKRRLNDSHIVDQVVYSDGMAAVSVFIEALHPGTAPVRTGWSSSGAVNIVTREVAHHLVTAVGEAPALSVQRVADSVEYHPPH